MLLNAIAIRFLDLYFYLFLYVMRLSGSLQSLCYDVSFDYTSGKVRDSKLSKIAWFLTGIFEDINILCYDTGYVIADYQFSFAQKIKRQLPIYECLFW